MKPIAGTSLTERTLAEGEALAREGRSAPMARMISRRRNVFLTFMAGAPLKRRVQSGVEDQSKEHQIAEDVDSYGLRIPLDTSEGYLGSCPVEDKKYGQ